MTKKMPILVIGMGERLRHDDALGLFVAHKIKALNYGQVMVINGIADSASLMEKWSGAGNVFVIDAVSSGAEAGKIYRFDAVLEEIPGNFGKSDSTHAMGLYDSIRLSRALGELPESLIVYGIEGADFSMGEGLSASAKKSALQVVEMIKNEIDKIIEQR